MSSHLERSEISIEDLHQDLMLTSGREFLLAVARWLRAEYGADGVIMGELQIAETQRVEVITMLTEKPEMVVEGYEAEGTPCAEVINEDQPKIVIDRADGLYPKDDVLVLWSQKSYVGVPLHDSGGQVIGVFCLFSSRPLRDPDKPLKALLKLAGRVGAEIEQLRRTAMLEAMAVASSAPSDHRIFRTLTCQISRALKVKAAFVAECLEDDPEHFRVLSFCFGGQPNEKAEGRIWSYRNTPCGTVKEQGSAFYNSGIKELFPDDTALVRLDLESYYGIAAYDSQGRLVGHIALLHDRPLSEQIQDAPVIDTFTTRTAIELERRLNDRDRQRSEEALLNRRKMESLGLIAGSVAHDFNNLLATMLGHCELAQDHLESDSGPAGRHVAKIGRTVENAKGIVAQLLDYAGHGNAGRKTRVDLNRLVRSVLDSLPLEQRGTPKLEIRLDGSPPVVEIDETQFGRVIGNLILNAIDAIEERDGRILISTSRTRLTPKIRNRLLQGGQELPDDCIRLCVCDNGIGMESETLSKIFDPYFSTKLKGRGLGLASVQGLVMSHASGLGIRSTPGAGTDITLYFPTASGEIAEETATPSTQDAQEVPSGERVLLVEDQNDVRSVVTEQLTSLGFRAVAVSGGLEALEVVQLGGRFDLAVIDVDMPDLDGWETGIRLAALSPETRIVMMSGHFEDDGLRPAEPPPYWARLSKPFLRKQLGETLSEVLSLTSRPEEPQS